LNKIDTSDMIWNVNPHNITYIHTSNMCKNMPVSRDLYIHFQLLTYSM